MDKFYIKYANAMDLLMSDTPMKPTKIFDNLGAIGGIGTIMYVLEVGEDLYLFDALIPGKAFEEIFENGMKELGYDPRKVKALYVSHGHFDHFGIADYLVDKYGIPVYMSKTDYDFSFGDCEMRNLAHWQLKTVPSFIDEDCVVDLSGEKVQIVYTPGHTPGGLSFILPVYDDGRPMHAALWGGTSLPADDKLKLAYRESLDRFKAYTDAYEVDAELCGHPFMDTGLERMAVLHNRVLGVPNPFAIGRAAYLRYAQMLFDMADAAIEKLKQ